MNIKKISLILLIALFFCFIVFKHYKAADKNYEEIFIIQVGAYKNYDNIIKVTKNLDNYLIYEEDNLYKIFIGLATDEEVFNKLTDTYAKDMKIFKKTLKITNKDFEKKLKEYDELIKITTKKENLNVIVKEELKLLKNILDKRK